MKKKKVYIEATLNGDSGKSEWIGINIKDPINTHGEGLNYHVHKSLVHKSIPESTPYNKMGGNEIVAIGDI